MEIMIVPVMALLGGEAAQVPKLKELCPPGCAKTRDEVRPDRTK